MAGSLVQPLPFDRLRVTNTARLKSSASCPLARDCQIPVFCPCDGDLAIPLEPHNDKEISDEVY